MSDFNIKNKIISKLNFLKDAIQQGANTPVNLNQSSLVIDKATRFVGINKSIPSCQLDVSGNINATTITNYGTDISSLTNIRIGINAGQVSQQTAGIAIGYQAGQYTQGTQAIAAGYQAGQYNQGQNTLAIGTQSGQCNQKDFAISIGHQAGQSNQGSYAIAIGYQAGNNSQDSNAIAIGFQTGFSNQTSGSIAIGWQSGQYFQNQRAIAIGYQAGQSNQQADAIAIGNQAGYISQGSNAVAIGSNAGQDGQRSNSIAIGQSSGQINQSSNSIALGAYAGQIAQQDFSIAIGAYAGQTSQNSKAIVIGYNSGLNQGTSSIIIGNGAGTSNVPKNTILINPTLYDTSFTAINPTVSGLYISPIRTVAGTASGALSWNSSTGEIVQYSGKTFIIQHPTKEDNYLVHACLEGPENAVYYRGQCVINDGHIDIKLPTYASKMASDFTIQLTPVIEEYSSLEDRELKTTKVDENGVFRVSGKNGKFNWLVIGKRNDIVVEPFKNDVVVRGEGPYKYIL